MVAATARACVLLLALLTPAVASAQEHVSFKPPAGWELGFGPQQTRDALIMEFVKKGEKVDAWTELITMQQVRRAKKSPPPRGFYDEARALQEKRCPGLSEWQVLEEAGEGTILYEWKTTGTCQDHPPQLELVRLLYGRNTIYRTAYTTRTPLAPEARQAWIEWLRGVELSR